MIPCWGITSGQAGMVSQVKALASVLKLSPELKKIQIRAPFGFLPNVVFASGLRNMIVPHLIAPLSDSLEAPYPELVISCGRRAALVAMGLKLRAPHTTFIHIQDPQVSARYFDLVVAMQHDGITGENVLKTRFALHTITPDVLQQAQQKFEPIFSGYAAPRVAVLLGGSTNKYTLSAHAMRQMIESLQRFQEHSDASLLITSSRRTGEDNNRMLREAFAGKKRVYMYDFMAENSYLGMLAVADAVIVTNDSVNMMSEAHATGKPLYILPLPGHENTKPARFAAQLIADGIARPLGTTLKSWSYPVSNEMEMLAQEVKEKLGAKR